MEEKNIEISKPTVSVIIPTYNRPNFLKEAIKSVLVQECKDFELLVIDDGSSDNIKEVVFSFDDHRIKYTHKENGGSSSARNLGIKKSIGKYITFLDDDDLWTKDRLSHAEILENDPDVDIVCSDIMFIDAEGRIDEKSIEKKQKLYSGNVIRPMFLMKLNPCFVATMILRRECFDKSGVFDESFKCSVDVDIERRLVLYSNVMIRGEKLYKVRVHDEPQLTDRTYDVEANNFFRTMDKFAPGGGPHRLPYLFFRYAYSLICVAFGVRYLVEFKEERRARALFKQAVLYNPFNRKALNLFFSKKKRQSLLDKASGGASNSDVS